MRAKDLILYINYPKENSYNPFVMDGGKMVVPTVELKRGIRLNN